MKARCKTALDAALHLIAYRAQSEWEIRSKLRMKGYADEENEAAVLWLSEHGYLNDEELAEEIFESYRREGLYGNRYIQRKLQSRGLRSDSRLTEEEETEKACRALARKAASVPSLLENGEKAAAFLFRRGFSGGAVHAALREAGEDTEDFPE